MEEELADQVMIQRALVGDIRAEEEASVTKIDRKRNLR